jgi:predicted Zn-dependent peptidase
MAFVPKVVDLDGLRVVMVPDERESVTVRVLVGVGSRNEEAKVAGVAHFLEHFVFKGTRLFPKMFDVSEAVEKVGGAFNAYTGEDAMGFWVKMDKGNLELAVRILGQLLGEAVLPEKHFDKERGTILEELKMYEDQPGSKAGMELMATLFGKKSSVGRPVIGTMESLTAMKVADLRQVMEEWFNRENMLVGIVGSFNEKEFLKLLEKEFKTVFMRKSKKIKADVYSWKKQAEPRLKLVSRAHLKQAHVSIGFRGIKLTHRLRYALAATNLVLGQSGISRLFKEVREKRGWAYSIGSSAFNMVDVGMVEVGAGLPQDKLREAIELIMEIVTGIGGKGKWGITAKELEEGKICKLGRYSLASDVPENILSWALSGLNFEGKIYTPEETRANIKGVTLDQVKEVCDLIFRKEHLNLVVVGDYEKLPFDIK